MYIEVLSRYLKFGTGSLGTCRFQKKKKKAAWCDLPLAAVVTDHTSERCTYSIRIMRGISSSSSSSSSSISHPHPALVNLVFLTRIAVISILLYVLHFSFN